MPEMTLRASISAYLDEVTVHRNPTTVRTYKGALLGLVKYLEEGAAVNVDTMKPSEVSVDLVVGYFKGLGRLRIVEGSRTSWISVTPRVIKTISDYLDVRLDIDKSVSRSPATLPVFSRHRPSEVGKIVALTPAGVRNIVPGRSLEALGPHYDGSITPKALRHYAVASLLPSLTTLHPRIVRHCKSHFENGQYDNAIFNAMKAIEEEVRTRIAADPTEIGVNLITTAMKKEPIQITFSPVAAEQDAHYNLFKGAIGTLKNPHSHRFVGITDPIRAFESLALASLLMRMLDEAA